MTNMPTGDAATFVCPEWLRSGDPVTLSWMLARGRFFTAPQYKRLG